MDGWGDEPQVLTLSPAVNLAMSFPDCPWAQQAVKLRRPQLAGFSERAKSVLEGQCCARRKGSLAAAFFGLDSRRSACHPRPTLSCHATRLTAHGERRWRGRAGVCRGVKRRRRSGSAIWRFSRRAEWPPISPSAPSGVGRIRAWSAPGRRRAHSRPTPRPRRPHRQSGCRTHGGCDRDKGKPDIAAGGPKELSGGDADDVAPQLDESPVKPLGSWVARPVPLSFFCELVDVLSRLALVSVPS